jgi:hypothetical protein
MPKKEKVPGAEILNILREGASATKVELWDKVKATASRPFNLIFVLTGVLIYIAAEYA